MRHNTLNADNLAQIIWSLKNWMKNIWVYIANSTFAVFAHQEILFRSPLKLQGRNIHVSQEKKKKTTQAKPSICCFFKCSLVAFGETTERLKRLR